MQKKKKLGIKTLGLVRKHHGQKQQSIENSVNVHQYWKEGGIFNEFYINIHGKSV